MLLPAAIRYGLSVFDFWKMTYGEIVMYIEEMGKKVLIDNYSLANLISAFVSNGLNGKKNPPIEELYPQIFGNTIENEDDEMARTNFIKDQWITFAAHHNKLRKQKEGDGLLT